jgi:hypothetical protein
MPERIDAPASFPPHKLAGVDEQDTIKYYLPAKLLSVWCSIVCKINTTATESRSEFSLV